MPMIGKILGVIGMDPFFVIFLLPILILMMIYYLTDSLKDCFKAVSDSVFTLLPSLQPLMSSAPSDDELLSNPQFAGLFQRLSLDKDSDDVPSAAEVVDDYEGEQESIDLQNIGEENDEDEDSGDKDAGDEASVRFLGLKDVVKNASKGITEGTEGEYRRSELNCPSF
jgi:hypothetical protein